MGLTQSSQERALDNEEEEEEEEEEDKDVDEEQEERLERERKGKEEEEEDELEQEPELLPFESSASPLSPQLSTVGSLNLGPSVRVWDPGHVLGPLPLHALSHKGRSLSSRLHLPPGAFVGDEVRTEVYLIRHGESNLNTLPELIGGRTPSTMLTTEGKRQARALGVFLLSHGLHFDAVFASPLERCTQTAISVCQEVNFPQEKIELADALMEMSQGQWEGLRRSEVYTPELVSIMTNSQPDFHAPGGESQRQVEFRMVEFLNSSVLPRAVKASLQKDEHKRQSKSHSLMQVHPHDDADETKVSSVEMPLGRHRNSSVKGSGKSRLQISSMGETAASTDENGSIDAPFASRNLSMPEQKAAPKAAPYYVGIFSHGMAIKCLLRGLLGSDPRTTHRLCIDNTSVTVLRHSTTSGWEIQRVNDTAHLRLL